MDGIDDLREPSVSSRLPVCSMERLGKTQSLIVICYAIVFAIAATILLSEQPGMNLLS